MTFLAHVTHAAIKKRIMLFLFVLRKISKLIFVQAKLENKNPQSVDSIHKQHLQVRVTTSWA